jgi:hypothetical protein
MIGLYNLITCHTTATLYFTSSTKCVHLQVVNQFTNRFMRTNYTTLFKSTLLNKYFMQFGTETRSQGRYSEQATGWTIGIRVPAGDGNFFLRHRVYSGSGAHQVCYSKGTGGSFPRD